MAQEKLYFMKFCTGDWMKDPALRACSYAAKGLWADMLCLMHEAPNRGFLQHKNGDTITATQLARMTGGGVDEVAGVLAELEAAGVYSRSKAGVIFSRRMVREEFRRREAVENGRLGGNPALKGDKGGVGKGDNPLPNPQRSEVRDQKSEEPRGEPPHPQNLLTAGHSHPATRFTEHDERFSAIAKAYPNRSGRAKGIAAAQEAASRILRGQDDLGDHPRPSDAAAWLLARVQQWAKSPMARRILAEENGKFMPSLASWMDDRKYVDPPGAWGEAGSAASTSPRAIYDRLRPEQKAECEAAGAGFTRSSDGWWSRVLGHAAKNFGGATA